MQGFVCCPRLYRFEDWFFEQGYYGGAWPLRQDGEPSAHAEQSFWDTIRRFEALTEAEQETYRVGGGCVELA